LAAVKTLCAELGETKVNAASVITSTDVKIVDFWTKEAVTALQ
jgi:hypothetical protein